MLTPTEPDEIRYRNALGPRKPAAPPPMKALTLWRPWSCAIVRGPKRVENRSWMPPRSAVGTEIAIHGGQRYDDHLEWPGGWRAPGASPIGIGGVARLIGAAYRPGQQRIQILLPPISMESFDAQRRAEIQARLHRIEEDEWATEGSCWWLFDEPTPIEPVWCKGAQGLWTVDPMIAAEVRRRVEKARGAAA